MTRPPYMRSNDGVWKDARGSIWVPDSSTDLQMRLCMITHAGRAEHRGVDVTEQAFRSQFTWKTLSLDVRVLIRACIHCVTTAVGDRVARPYGAALHTKKSQ